MIRDRIVGLVVAARGALTWAWPFLLAVAVTANLVVLPLIVVRQSEVLRQTREATDANRRLIERGLPCLDGADPNSEACANQALRDTRLGEALAAVQGQHDREAQHLDDVINRLADLQARQHGLPPEAIAPPVVAPPRTTTTRPRAVTPTTTRPRTTATTVRPTPTTVPAPPTTACRPPDCKPKGKP